LFQGLVAQPNIPHEKLGRQFLHGDATKKSLHSPAIQLIHIFRENQLDSRAQHFTYAFQEISSNFRFSLKSLHDGHQGAEANEVKLPVESRILCDHQNAQIAQRPAKQIRQSAALA